MPYSVCKLPNKNKYRVKNVETGRILAKSTTLDKAKKQIRLIKYLDKKKK